MRILYMLVITSVLCIDQISKEYLRPILENGNIIRIANHMQLVNVWNPGVSFGMFNTLKNNKIIFSMLSASIIIILLIYLIKQGKDNKLFSTAISFLIGGALGNLIDRIRYGAVYDFIDFYINNWHWPIFNIADSFIVLGVLILIFKWNVYEKILTDQSKTTL